MASLFQVLHSILKFLKHNDSKLKDDFICLSMHHIQKIPCQSFHQLDARELARDATESKLSFSRNLAESGILTGSLLQLLCSLLEQTSLEATDGQDMHMKLVDIVPKLAASLQEQHLGPKSLYQYSKHKILVNLDILSSSALLVTTYYNGYMKTSIYMHIRYFFI
jgi:protein Lines